VIVSATRLAKEGLPLGRRRSFDEENALEAAAGCFWSRGFKATSVRDLACSMGIAGPSLYNAFGGKRGLFTAALDHYCSRSMRERIARLEASTNGVAAIEAFFADVIKRSLQDEERKGCFLVNAALEMAPHDAGLAEAISAYVAEIRSFFKRHIEKAQACGETSPAIDPDHFASHLLSVLMGIRVLARCCPDRSFLKAAAGPALQRLRITRAVSRKCLPHSRRARKGICET
jgi:TetR/AcrR family transcriptional regulator, transcriptional repressor for nem operon